MEQAADFSGLRTVCQVVLWHAEFAAVSHDEDRA